MLCSAQGAKPRKRKSAKSKSATIGSRNESVACEGFSLLNAGMDPDLLEEELLEYNAANCDPPLPESEVSRIAANVVSSHQKNNDSVSHATDLGNAKRLCCT
ncbi:primase C-terminal domain-containing protein [Burkholderia cenocepacia]|uniref:primase C-terminal domain-containing protein n=1 Tax=Burkholderia cenocepacia TaxID=95486 RepID=UPI002938FB48|nr:primase C-terminal domain-containing protein [Burkholderia cenocepacia]